MNAIANITLSGTDLDKLRHPFAPNQISKLPKESRKQADERKAGNNVEWNCKVCGGMHHKNAVHLDYVGHAAATDRLLDTDIAWTWEPLALDQRGLPALDQDGGLWIKLTVCGVTRLGYGHADGKTGGNAVKEAIGDAIRNAGMRFGMALDLWHKGELHLDAEEQAGGTQQEREVSPPPAEMPPAEYAKVVGLIQATGIPMKALLKEYQVQSIKLLSPEQYADAVERLTAKMGEKAKAQTNAAANGFGELIDDEIPY